MLFNMRAADLFFTKRALNLAVGLRLLSNLLRLHYDEEITKKQVEIGKVNILTIISGKSHYNHALFQVI